MENDSDDDQLLCQFRDLKRSSHSTASGSSHKNSSLVTLQVSSHNCEVDDDDDKPLSFTFLRKLHRSDAQRDEPANNFWERSNYGHDARFKDEKLTVYKKRKRNSENLNATPRLVSTTHTVTVEESKCGVNHVNLGKDQNLTLIDDMDDMPLACMSNIKWKKQPSNVYNNGLPKMSKLNVSLSTVALKLQVNTSVEAGRTMGSSVEMERETAATVLEKDEEKYKKDNDEKNVDSGLKGNLILKNDGNAKSIHDEHNVNSRKQPYDSKKNFNDISIDDPKISGIIKMGDEDDDTPLGKMFCTELRKRSSNKRKLPGTVKNIKEEVDEDDATPLGEWFVNIKKNHSDDDTKQNHKSSGRWKRDTDSHNNGDEDDDDILLSKMLCPRRKKTPCSKVETSGRKINIATSLTRKTEKDNEKMDVDEDYDSPLIQKIHSIKKSSRKTGTLSKGITATTEDQNTRTLAKKRNSEKMDEVLDEENEDDESYDSEEDDDEDYDLAKSARSMKKNSAVKRKTKASMKNRKTAISSKMKNESDDEKDDDETDDEEEDSDEEDSDSDDAPALKKSGTVSRSKMSSSKLLKQRRKQKLKKINDISECGGQKWTSLEHNGVIFPPPYKPHGVKMLYKGKPVDLTPEQEEVATMFAVMRDTDYATKPKFVENFWNDWKKLLGPHHVIEGLESCDFTPIYDWNISEKEKKKQMSAQEKKAAKEEKMKQEEKYMWALVDGVKEKVGNFRVEPPGLFRGRGEHPKMGKVKRRIYPEDIVINIGAGAPIPECPIPGRQWKEIRHDNTVTWLAYWNDPINSKEQKYVFLAPSSSLKGQSDKEKYEKARVLKDYIDDIRKTYTANFTSSDSTTRQIAVATYLIDRLALRAGNEKDDDEADTVGCCSLKVEHVTLVPPTSLEFDFLGKDSIRYYNKVEVIEPVYRAIGDFKKNKDSGQDLFDKLDTYKLNAHLKNIMPQLTAKVFRTYNASITLDTLLVNTDGRLIPEKIAAYQKANKEVAILCNHQRSVPKTHGAQMEKLEGKLTELTELLDELEEELESIKKGKPVKKDSEGNCRRNQNPETLERKILQTKNKIERMKLDMTIKEDLKTVALGTSKINYMDPRITVAWCKRHEVPIEKVFNKSLLAKFSWAMDVDMSFRF